MGAEEHSGQTAKTGGGKTPGLMTLDQVAEAFIAGDGRAAFILSCLDFFLYSQLMFQNAPLEEAQIVWQHSRDLARLSGRKLGCEEGQRFLSLMDDMLEKKDQDALTACTSYAAGRLNRHVDITDAAQLRFSPGVEEKMRLHEEKLGIDNGRYRLLLATRFRKGGASAGRSFSGGSVTGCLIKFGCLVAFMLLCSYVILRSLR